MSLGKKMMSLGKKMTCDIYAKFTHPLLQEVHPCIRPHISLGAAAASLLTVLHGSWLLSSSSPPLPPLHWLLARWGSSRDLALNLRAWEQLLSSPPVDSICLNYIFLILSLYRHFLFHSAAEHWP